MVRRTVGLWRTAEDKVDALLACGCITFTLLRVLLESSAEPEDAARPDREVPLPPRLPPTPRALSCHDGGDPPPQIEVAVAAKGCSAEICKAGRR